MNKIQALLKEREDIYARIDEINRLLPQFNLLMQQYNVDIERLLAIEESGSLFIYTEKTSCPLCGALPNRQYLSETYEGDVSTIVKAARAEIEKIKKLSIGLQETVIYLQSEFDDLTESVKDIEKQCEAINFKDIKRYN